MCIATKSGHQQIRRNSKMISQLAATAYRKMHFLAVAVTGIHSTLSYPLPFSVNIKSKLMKRSNIGNNKYSAR